MKIIMLGAPGAGKGTQADILSKILNIPTISTGNILRAAVKNQTPIGLKAKEYMDAGALVPDEVIIGILNERLAQSDCAKGYILDGVPRTIAQAEALDAAGIRFDHVISIEIEDEAIMDRMAGRRVCEKCGASYHINSTSFTAIGQLRSSQCNGTASIAKRNLRRTIRRSKVNASLLVRSRARHYHQSCRIISKIGLYGDQFGQIIAI